MVAGDLGSLGVVCCARPASPCYFRATIVLGLFTSRALLRAMLRTHVLLAANTSPWDFLRVVMDAHGALPKVCFVCRPHARNFVDHFAVGLLPRDSWFVAQCSQFLTVTEPCFNLWRCADSTFHVVVVGTFTCFVFFVVHHFVSTHHFLSTDRKSVV